MEKGGFVFFRGFHWWPLPNTTMSADVPTEIAEVFSEAIMAQFANCPRASAVMARRTLEAITVDKGESKGTLAERLAQLGKAGILHPSLAEWAKEVRLIGNLGAHYDPINSISEEDAIQLIGFVKELIKFLYELPAELERRRNLAGTS